MLIQRGRTNEERHVGSLHTPKCGFSRWYAKQGNASWAADSSKAVFKEAVVGGGWHDNTSRYTTKKEKKVFHYQVTKPNS